MAKHLEKEAEAGKYVKALFLQELSPQYVFHNYSHTEHIVEICRDFAQQAGFSKKALQNLLIAAWFSESGFTRSYITPWKESQKIVTGYLEDQEVNEERIQEIVQIIQGAFLDPEPVSTSEQILFDAYWSFLGERKLDRMSNLLRMEKEQLENKRFSVLEWNQYMQNLLLHTKIQTPWGLNNFEDRKNRNVDEINSDLREAEKEDVRKKTGKDFGRGVDTIYRVTLKNHLDFSSIADGKANMIISINTLVLSIIITVGSAGLSMGQAFMEEQRLLLIPIVILMLSSLVAIVFAVLSAIPKVSQNIFAKEDIAAHKVSMLYFGNFLQLSKQEFVEYLRDLKEDQEILYDDLSKDLYSLGQVLQKKYRLLTISYRVFIWGLVLSVIALLLILVVT